MELVRRSRACASGIGRILRNVDVIGGNEEDLQKGLGIAGPEMAAKSKLDTSAFLGIIDRVLERYPHIKIVATTLPEVHSTNRHGWAAVSWINGRTYTSPQCELDVHDRVGGGDGFASGFFYGVLTDELPEQVMKLGWLMVRCLPRFLAIQRWRRSRKFACSHKARRHEFSAVRLDPNRSSLQSLRCEISAENGLTISHAESSARMWWWYKPTEGRPVTKLAGAKVSRH